MADPLIVLTTDFGTADTYVGVMKGVIAGIAPAARVVDLTHEVRPQDIRHGAYSLLVAVPYFPPGSIFVTVVDPGVGSARRAVAVRAGDHIFVAPDNGVLSLALHETPPEAAVLLSERRYQLPRVSTTFHGRDIFAPAGAHLAAGVPLEAFGPALDPADLVMVPAPRRVRDERGVWHGEILHVDRFGNMITSLRRRDLGLTPEEPPEAGGRWRIAVGETLIAGVSGTFADVAIGAPVAYIGSDDFLEIAVRNASGAARLGGRPGTEVRAWQTPKEGLVKE